jgi:ATP-binding cassette subfamily C (CFTR/MRP) protein 1
MVISELSRILEDDPADVSRTKIGEKGITLSGGQRQRVCLARAAYDKSSEIVLLDDPLSAVDAHVGHHLLHNCILSGPLADRTRVLVTHHLDVLPQADLVVVMDRDETGQGRIIQQGTYNQLRDQPGVFQTLMNDFGSTATEEAEPAVKADAGEEEDKPKVAKSGGGKLLLDEERELGAVSWRVYAKYGKAMGSWPAVSIIFFFLGMTQAANVGNSLFLGFWSGGEIKGFKQGDYMAIYAGESLSFLSSTLLDGNRS